MRTSVPITHRFTLPVDIGDGAVMDIVNPVADPHLEWMLRYAGDLNPAQAGRFSAAHIVECYDYLISGHINMGEATRRLRMLRAARREAIVRAQFAKATERAHGIAPAGGIGGE